MKRCPQCEFIYEDDQSTCDMDGTTLASDAPLAAGAAKQSSLRSFAVPAVVGSILAAVLILAFYASPLLLASPDARTRLPEAQSAPSNIPAPAPTATQPADVQPTPNSSPEDLSGESSAEQVAMLENKGRPSETNHADSRNAHDPLTIRRGLPPLPRVPSLPRLPAARVGKQTSATVAEKNRNSAVVSGKRPSKVGSFLKKTGRFIKKPFKF